MRDLLNFYKFDGDNSTPVIFGSALSAQREEVGGEGDGADGRGGHAYRCLGARAKPFLMPVGRVFDYGRGTMATGRIETGVVKVNDEGWDYWGLRSKSARR